MKKLDNFFKNKMDDRQVPFQEKYWEDALAMLDERDKRKRKGIIWWWFAGGFFIITLALGAYWFSNGALNTGSKDQKEQTKTSTLTENVIKLKTPQSSKNSSKTVVDEITNKQQAVEKVTTDISSSFDQIVESSNKKEEKKSPAGKEENNQGREPSVNNLAPPTKERVRQNNTELNQKGQAVTPAKKQKQESVKPSLLTELPSFGKSKVKYNVQIEPIASSTPIIDNSVSTKGGTGEEENKKERTTIASLLPLPVKSFLVTYKESSPELSREEIEAVLNIAKTNKLQWHIGLGAMLNPSDGKRLLGANIALMITYPINKKTAIYARTAYRRQGGTFGNIQESRQIDFRFGASEERFSLQPSQLHYISAGAGLERRWQKHQLGVGLAHQYLLGIRGDLTSTEKGEFTTDFSSLVTKENGWLNEKGFVKNILGAELFYQFQLQNRIELELKLNYWPSTVLNEEVNIPKEVRLREYGPMFIDFGLNYQL